MLLAQLSDCHLDRPGDAQAERFDRIAGVLARLSPAPDLILISGDLVDEPGRRRYRLAADKLAGLPAPVRLLPGNHDDRTDLRNELVHHDYLGESGPMDYVLAGPALRLVCLDTLVEGELHGALDGDQIAWLRTRLAEDGQTPTAICLHHPPFSVGVTGLDAIGCYHDGALGDVVAGRPNIARVLAGHVHMPVTVDYAGTTGMTAPSVATAFEPGWTGSTARTQDASPAVLLHRMLPEAGLVSHAISA